MSEGRVVGRYICDKPGLIRACADDPELLGQIVISDAGDGTFLKEDIGSPDKAGQRTNRQQTAARHEYFGD